MSLFKRLSALLLAVWMVLSLASCGASGGDLSQPSPSPVLSESASPDPDAGASPSSRPEGTFIDPVGNYYDPEHVVLYIHIYGHLPLNYITKSEARELGWSGGSVEPYSAGGAIGGDIFTNREGTLPKADGRIYYECDLYTNGQSKRGAYRLVFSNDGLYFYTDDHYDTFTELYITEEGTAAWK